MSDSSRRPHQRGERGDEFQPPLRDPRRLAFPSRPSRPVEGAKSSRAPGSPNRSAEGARGPGAPRGGPRAHREERGAPRPRPGDREGSRGRERRSGPRDWDDVAWRDEGGDDGSEGDWADDRDAARRRPAPRRPQPSQRANTRQAREGARRQEAGDWDDGRRDWEDGGRRSDGWDDDPWEDQSRSRMSRRPRDQRDQRDVWAPPARDARSQRSGAAGGSQQRRSGWRETSAMLAAAVAPSRLPAWLNRMLPKNQRARITAIIMLVVILVCAVGSIPVGYLAYASTMSLAKDGLAHLKLAETDFKTLATSPTNLVVINDAQSHLQSAHDDFAQVQFRAGLLTPAQAAPTAGAKIGAAVRLTPLAVEGTQAGILACDALKVLVTGLKNPLGTTGGLTPADMSRVTSDVDQITALFGQITGQVQQLRPSDLTLDPRLGPLVASVQQQLPQLTRLVSDLDDLAHALPQLLGVGAPSTYLVLILDSSELRPTGGFIGNFGALQLDSGRMDPNFHISDITLVDSSVKFSDVKYLHTPIPIPDEYAWLKTIFQTGATDSWSLRDSNLDPDYPTTARYAEQLYAELYPDAQKNIQASGSTLALYDPAKSGQFTGVITLSLGFFQQALGVTGSLQINDGPIHETVNAKNFVQKIHYYALAAPGTGPDNEVCGDTSCAKVFTSDVVKAFMAKVKSNLSQYMGGLAKLFYDSLKTKDIEVYLTNPKAEQLLLDLHAGAAVEAPASGDSVFQVEANIGANKDNALLTYAMSDHITLDQSGGATHNLTWKYTWPNDPATLNETFAAGKPNYHSYSRIFTPPSATFISQSNLAGFGQDAPSATTFGRKVFHGAAYAYAVLGQSATYSVAWKAPGVITHDAAGYHYHLLFQREAGIIWPLSLAITLPSCAKLLDPPVTSGLTSAQAYAMKGNTFTLTGPLTQDIQLQLDYSC